MGESGPTVRMFVAIEAPGTICRIMASAREFLGTFEKDLKWIESDNIHITVKFLGDVEERTIPQILDSVDRVTAETRAFRLCSQQVGGGPRMDQARVVWLGWGGETGILSDLHGRLEDAVEVLGIPKEKRRYYPHITFARATRKPVDLPGEVAELSNPVHFMVERLVIFRSDLRPDGAVYTPLGYSVFRDRTSAG